jgi:hypothetical protein
MAQIFADQDLFVHLICLDLRNLWVNYPLYQESFNSTITSFFRLKNS